MKAPPAPKRGSTTVDAFLPLVAFDQPIFLKSVLGGPRGLKKSAEILSDSFKLFEV